MPCCTGRVRVAVMTSLLLGACAAAPEAEPADSPNEGMFQDFLDGKYDSAGHPLNAKVFDHEGTCETACSFELPANAQRGPLMANARVKVATTTGAIATVRFVDDDGEAVASETLTADRVRAVDEWIDLAVTLPFGTAVRVEVQGAVELDYVEVFPSRLGLAIAPGSGTFADDDVVTFELPLNRSLDSLHAGDLDLLPRLRELQDAGTATTTDTELRRLISVPVVALLGDRADITELHATGAGDPARIQVRRAPAACHYEGDADGMKVLVTGFQPFPANGWHDNVSAVAVTAMNPAVLRGAQVMRVVLPVEYDRAASAIVDIIERCAPAAVISFGQGGSAIALEETAYNLQDTGEISGGVPDNRGIIRAAQPIEPGADAERSSLLPLDAIAAALEDAGESPRPSTDPGRYICNNVMFSNIGTMAPRGGRGGFIHLPYTTSFDDDVRARFGRVVELAVQATVDN